MPISYSLAAYSGQWTKAEAAHLLRRTLMAPTFTQIQTAETDGLSVTLTKLLTNPSVNPPVTTDSNEPIAQVGTTWINSVYPSGDTQPTETIRVYSLGGWLIQNLNSGSYSISEKMTLFWQNHFAAEHTFDARATYQYVNLLRTYALGDFKELIKKITIDPCMLHFLNGVQNQSFSPNENYARELLELYTIGKGPLVATGDYTNYTEQDVSEGAKILTGWLVNGMRSTTLSNPVSVFVPQYHSTSDKQLSARFGNQTITAGGATEYESYIDVIFQYDEVAKFICRKLYRYFVNYKIDNQVETAIIEPLAQTFKQHNFVIQPVLAELLASEHFYDVGLRGSIIKSPLEFLCSLLNPAQSVPQYDPATNEKIYLQLYSYAQTLGQGYMSPPNVGGWPAYYQAPAFSQLWINSTYLKQRFQVGAYLSVLTGIDQGGKKFKINALQLLSTLSDPSDIDTIVQDLCILFFPKAVDLATQAKIKANILNGLPDFEWTIQYNDYKNDPSNTTLSDPIRIRIETGLYCIFQLPEFQTF